MSLDLSAISLSIASAGIDYLTLTSTNQATKRDMSRYFGGLIAADLKLGHKVIAGGAYGFYGKRTKHGLLAEKRERTMLQVSGAAAMRTFKLVRLGDNCTRLDIQVTLRVTPGAVGSLLALVAQAARSAPALRGKKPKVKNTDGDNGTETVYIGKRASDIFIRCYDKYEESGKEEYKDCVRFEVELKGKTAKAVWAKMATDGTGPGYLLGLLRYVLERRGIELTGTVWPSEPQALPLKEKTCLETLKGWWASQVAPSIKRYTAEAGWTTPFCILFEQALTDCDLSTMLKGLSVQWGN
jgi:hypothetical protein